MEESRNKPTFGRWSYLRVAETLRQEILTGRYKPGKRLPGEPALAQRFGVGRATVARALEVLDHNGLIFRVRGSGTYVQRSVTRGEVRLLVGYLVSDISLIRHSPVGLTLEAAHQTLEQRGHALRLLTRNEFAAGGEVAALRRRVRQGELHALILSCAMDSDITARTIGQILPTVSLFADQVPDNIPSVSADVTYAFYLATRHLLDLGHRRIALLGGIGWRSIGYRSYQGFRLALQLAGVDAAACPRVQCGFRENIVHQAACGLLRDHPEVSGVVCADDVIAALLMDVARSMGRSVPRDLSVVGCNDMPFAAGLNPPLTTLRIDYTSMGTLGCDLLLARTLGQVVPSRHYLEPELIVRQSTAAPADRPKPT